MRIVTWNINRFNGTWDWYSNKCDLEISGRKRYAKYVVDKLKEIIRKDDKDDKYDDIVVLQEVPFNNKEWEGGKDKGFEGWKNFLKKEFKEEFIVHSWFDKEQEKERGFNYNGSKNITVAITRKDSGWKLRGFDNRIVQFKQSKVNGQMCYDYANRYIEMENGDISLLGFHVKMANKEQWSQIRSVAKNSEFTFIVGDFNTNDLKNKNDANMEYLKNNYNRMIEKDIITNNQTIASIDNIFVSRQSGFDKTKTRVDVIDYCFVYNRNKKRYSDHNMCICELL